MPLVRRLVVGRDEKFFAHRAKIMDCSSEADRGHPVRRRASTLKLQLQITGKVFALGAQADKMSRSFARLHRNNPLAGALSCDDRMKCHSTSSTPSL